MHNFIGKKINKNRNNINVITEFYFKIELKQGSLFNSNLKN